LARKNYKTVKKSISLREDVYEIAEDMAERYFQGNLSAFIAFTITAYKDGLTTVIKSEHPQAKEALSELAKKDAKKTNFVFDVMDIIENKK
jgi:hypothetical protein